MKFGFWTIPKRGGLRKADSSGRAIPFGHGEPPWRRCTLALHGPGNRQGPHPHPHILTRPEGACEGDREIVTSPIVHELGRPVLCMPSLLQYVPAKLHQALVGCACKQAFFCGAERSSPAVLEPSSLACWMESSGARRSARGCALRCRCARAFWGFLGFMNVAAVLVWVVLSVFLSPLFRSERQSEAVISLPAEAKPPESIFLAVQSTQLLRCVVLGRLSLNFKV